MSAQPEIEISEENLDIESLNLASLDEENLASLDETSLFSQQNEDSEIGSDVGSDSIKLNEFEEDVNELIEEEEEEDDDENLKKYSKII